MGHFTPGRFQSSQLVIPLSSSTVARPIGGPGHPFLPLRWLSLLFFLTTHCHMLSTFARPEPVRSSCVMVFALDENQPTPLLLPLPSLPLPLILFLSKVATHSVGPRTLASSLTCAKCSLTISLSSSTLWITVMAPTLFLSPQYFVSAFTFTPFGVQQTWPAPGTSVSATHSSRPRYVPPTNSVAEAVPSTAADVRLQTTFSRQLNLLMMR